MSLLRPRAVKIATVATLVLGSSSSLTTPAAAVTTERDEAVVSTSSPITDVVESVVRVKVPLPESVGPHPEACNWLSYLRFRDRNGPEHAADADRVLVAQPGVLEGAGAFDSVARNTVQAAATDGKHIEFWALDRRSNCLDDNTGIEAAVAQRDPSAAFDYYYHGKPVNGRTFAGFEPDTRAAWLAEIGLEQTVRDQFDLLRAELPDQATRKQKVLCGGHSLGGLITGAFVQWSFGPDPADAGYNQCAGYFALDTAITPFSAALPRVLLGLPAPDPGLGYDAQLAALRNGLLPTAAAAPALINPETMTLLGVAGAAASTDPQGISTLAREVPDSLNARATLGLLFAPDPAALVVGAVHAGPTAADFNLTNEAALGTLLGSQSEVTGVLATGAGFYTGGPVTPKLSPLPNQLTDAAPLPIARFFLGSTPRAVPAIPNGPLYRWQNYDQVTVGPYTSPDESVTDIQELARSLAEQPLGFTENYFPTRLIIDILSWNSAPMREHMTHPEGLTANPTLTILAEHGLLADIDTSDLHPVLVPGYKHLDVLTAAPRQNSGRPEIVSTTLAHFATN